MKNFELLNSENITETKSEIFKKYGTEAGITDFAIISGGYVSEDKIVFDKKLKKIMASPWWIKSKTENDEALYATCTKDKFDKAPMNSTQIGIRPFINYSKIFKDNMIDYSMKEKETSEEIKYGEYPQWITEKAHANKLEALLSLNILRKTGKEYMGYPEYICNSSKYIRCIANEASKRLSNGSLTNKGQAYWIKVTPISWIVNKNENIMLSKYILVSGIEYKNIEDFLKNSFSKEIEPIKIITPANERHTYMDELVKAKQALLEIKKICEQEPEDNSKKLVLEIIKQATLS